MAERKRQSRRTELLTLSNHSLQALDQQHAPPNTLYVGNLHAGADEIMLLEIFSTLGLVEEVKVIRDKASGLSMNYAFVTYADGRCAEMAKDSIHGRVLHGQPVRVNWALQKEQHEDTAALFHIFVGNLSFEISNEVLYQAFRARSNCSGARVLWDHATNRSKGYGFVSYATQEDAQEAICTMDGEFVGHRRVRCAWAVHKQTDQETVASLESIHRADPFNSTVYVGNVGLEMVEADLRRWFGEHGALLDVKLYRRGNFAFVQFAKHESAVNAIMTMNGKALGESVLKCSWGRRQPQQPAVMGGSGADLLLGLHGQPMQPFHNLNQLRLVGPGIGAAANAGLVMMPQQQLHGLAQMQVGAMRMMLHPQHGLGQSPHMAVMGGMAPLPVQQIGQGALPLQQMQQQGPPMQVSTLPGPSGASSAPMAADPNLYYGMYYAQ